MDLQDTYPFIVQGTECTLQPEAQLPRRDRATRNVSKFVLRFTKYGRQKGFKQQK